MNVTNAVLRGYATENNSQDGRNDNPYSSKPSRTAFEVGAYFMRKGEVPRGPFHWVKGMVLGDGGAFSVRDHGVGVIVSDARA